MPSQRPKALWRWIVVVGSAAATAGFLGAVVNGPQPTHASPPMQVVVQQAPTLQQMLDEDARQANADDSGSPQDAPSPRFRTRGS